MAGPIIESYLDQGFTQHFHREEVIEKKVQQESEDMDVLTFLILIDKKTKFSFSLQTKALLVLSPRINTNHAILPIPCTR